MKSIIRFVSIIILFVVFQASAQTITINGKVSDKQTKEALIGVNILIAGTDRGTVTDITGHFQLTDVSANAHVIFSYLGYETKNYKASEIPSIVYLTPKANQLEQVIISAGQKVRQRRGVPISVTQISAKELEETQPVVLEEILNKAPGIMMVDLGNEQHSMSIRQPISYKSVFLYMEDGIPIRATGEFNHNALIEINYSALKNVEIIRGPYSSLYGSGAIGGAINFITKEPTAIPTYRLKTMINNLGFRQIGMLASGSKGKSGIIGTLEYRGRRNGYREHSDYDKISFFTKINRQINNKTYLKTGLNFIDYRTDMTGGLDSLFFYSQDYTSQYRFTYRKVKALRLNTQLVCQISGSNKLRAVVYGRYNIVGQNPHYRIKDDYKPWSGTGDPNLAHGEINQNKFMSIGSILSDEYSTGKWNISFGGSADYSPAAYWAKYIRIHKTDDGIYDSYQETDSVKTDYTVNIFNLGLFGLAEYKLNNEFKLTFAARYDNILYDFDNHLSVNAYSGAPDSKNRFKAFTPKIGAVYTVNKYLSFYGNYSKGFRPPEVGELYRGVKVPSLKPVYYDNYEGGAWISLYNKKLIIDMAYYDLQAQNEIITVRLNDGSRVNQNAARTDHQGFEYSIQYFPYSNISLTATGAISSHKFIKYTPKGKDFSGNLMPGAPKWIGSMELKYYPAFIRKSYIGLEWYHVDPYYMDEANTQKYDGYDIFNIRMGKRFKHLKVWFNVLNLTDKLYATSASKSAWGVSYRPGEKRSLNVGLSYTW